MIERKFTGEDDVERVRLITISHDDTRADSHDSHQARHLILRSSGAERTAALAEHHSKLARQALEGLPESEARTALDHMARDTLTRKK
jgi:hexaprenyl-diphosphate synthase